MCWVFFHKCVPGDTYTSFAQISITIEGFAMWKFCNAYVLEKEVESNKSIP